MFEQGGGEDFIVLVSAAPLYVYCCHAVCADAYVFDAADTATTEIRMVSERRLAQSA